MKYFVIILSLLLLSGCGKTRLVPQAYMPTPPEILMKAPRELNTIKVTKKADDDKSPVTVADNKKEGDPK
jgi:uncharacterized lipoprotein YajG